MKFISELALKRTLHQDISRAGSDYCVNHISPGTFADFRLKIFTQEKNMVIHVRKIFNCNVSFQIPLSKCLVFAKEL